MPPRSFVVVPVYNERETVEAVLSKCTRLDDAIDELVIVDDGSSDGSSAVIDRWAQGRPHVTVLRHPVNWGYSQALLTGFTYFIDRLERNELSSEDIVATVDADGQHDPLELPRLLKTMKQENLDVLWGRRDFSLYPLWKRLGNYIMSLIATVFGGQRFRDVESGYCLFRLGALATALEYRTRDWRYSISMTLAVIFARLGFRLSNESKVSVPLYRSRTRIRDVFADAMAALCAWAAVTFAPLRRSRDSRFRFGVGLAALAFISTVLVLMAVKPIFLGYDSINNYVHVWFISKSLFESQSIPLQMPWLENGEALTYPYGFVPWTFAALLFPLLGDYAVTWTMVLGFILMVLVVYKTRLRSETWLLALYLLFPILFWSLLSFQLAFIWGSLFAYLYIHYLEKNARWRSLFWFVLAASTHLLLVGLILALYNIAICIFRREMRWPVLRVTLLSVPFLAPIAWYMLQAPAVADNGAGYLALDAAKTLALRGSIFFFPFLLWLLREVLSQRTATRYIGPFAVASAVAVVLFAAFATGVLRGLTDKAENHYQAYLGSDLFLSGATYRLLEPTDQEQGHYFFVKEGAVLSQELFGESQFRRSWQPDAYYCFLEAKKVDFVVLNRGYQNRFATNERQLLLDMSYVLYSDPQGRFEVFDLHNTTKSGVPSVRQCLGS